MRKNVVKTLIFLQPEVGATALPVIGDYVFYNKGNDQKSAPLVEFVNAFSDMDPVLELKDGNRVRIFQAGDDSYMRAEAAGILDNYK